MISRPVLVSRLPVGSSAKMIDGLLTRDSDEVRRASTRARELWHKVGGNAAQLCPILYGLFVNNITRAEHQAARDLSQEFLSAAESVENTPFVLDAHAASACSSVFMGEFDLALE